MANQITVSSIHHVRLTVTDLQRSIDFYTNILGFSVALDGPPPSDHPDHAVLEEAMHGGVVLISGNVLLALRPVAPAGDKFDENRVGLDHLSFSVESHADLVRAVEFLDEQGISRGEIKDLGETLGIYVMPIRDPDNIQVELTAPRS